MSEYKQSRGPKGRSLYFKREEGEGFRMVSKDSIPENILATMEPDKPVDDQKPEFRKCIFCGNLGTEIRRLNNQDIELCLEHYHSKTAGECIEQLRNTVND